MRETIDRQLSDLGYSEKWLEYGYLTPESLARQHIRFNEPDADQNAEHYRFSVLISHLQNRKTWSEDDLEHFLEIASEDPDSAMARSAIVALIQCESISDDQFYSLASHPRVERFEISRIHLRHDLLRSLRRHGLTKVVLDRCIREGDEIIHRALLDNDELPRIAVERLSVEGANKAVRHIAAQLLKSKKYQRAG